MVNAQRGEVSLEAGGETYVLSFSINAICELEEKLGESIDAVLPRLGGEKPDFKILRAVLWALMIDHRPEITVAEAGRILPDGGFPALTVKLQEAIERAMPQSDPAGNPQKASRAGTGKTS